jgi:2OG-Fe(II) oxygenase superfamily
VLNVFDFDHWNERLPHLAAQYAANHPYPHIVLDDFLHPDVYEAARREFPSADGDEWTNYLHINERKYANRQPETWGPTLQRIALAFTSDQFAAWVSALSGHPDLLADWSMDGGGLHQSFRGGYLNVHADFTAHHTQSDWRRRVNLILYLNEGWQPEWNGGLELWSADMKRCERTIMPIGNRAVLFSTDLQSFHGHPEPLACPSDRARQSMALYYFSRETNPAVHSTNYRARPGDGIKSAGIYADKQLLHAYDVLKRRFHLSDGAASGVMKLFSRKR